MADGYDPEIVSEPDYVPAENEPASKTPSKPDAEPEKQRDWKRIALMLAVPLLLIVAGAYFWMISGRFESTDNAYVQQDMVAVAPQIGGPIIEVAVRENQHVEKGDLLFRIDPEPYRLALAEANAAIAAAQVDLETLRKGYAASTTDIAAAREDIAFAKAKFARQQALLDKGFTTRADYDAARHAVSQAREELRQAEADAAKAKARLATGSAVPGRNPVIARALVQREQAQLNLRYTQVHAPSAGTVTQIDRLQIGQMMVAGLPAVTIVGGGESWVEANFKETQLDKMYPGQPVEIELDAYPDLELDGHVQSIGAGTGSEFSILPAQNATGNWVKVTQRIPVRIAIDTKSPRQLIAGMSAEVTVDVREKTN